MNRRDAEEQDAARTHPDQDADPAREAGFIPLPMRPARLRGGNPPTDPPDREDDGGAAPGSG